MISLATCSFNKLTSMMVGLGLSIGWFGSGLNGKIPTENRTEFLNAKPKPTEIH